MENFISTDTAILLSFMLKKMPKLSEYIRQCSTEYNPKAQKAAPLPITILTPAQIHEARAHPNIIVLQALGAVAQVQDALLATDNRLLELKKQRTNIQEVLAKILTTDEHGNLKITGDTGLLQGNLQELVQTKKGLDDIKENMQTTLNNIDQLVTKQVDRWQKHQEYYFAQVIEQLQKYGITLTETEKNVFLSVISTKSSVEHARHELEKLGISLPKDASYFSVAIHKVVADVLSRKLQKVNNSSVGEAVKNLSAIIEAEHQEYLKIIEENKQQFRNALKDIVSLKQQAQETPLLSEDQLNMVYQIAETAAAPEVAPKAPEAGAGRA